MLVNVPLNEEQTQFLLRVYELLSEGGTGVENPQTGVYICYHHNFDHFIEDHILETYPEFDSKDKEYLSPYGVCDSVEQMLDYYGDSLTSPDRCFCVAFTPVRKENQPERGGWRWHKWGPYIGNQNPQWEYLYDEPTIEVIYCFHVLEVKSGTSSNPSNCNNNPSSNI